MSLPTKTYPLAPFLDDAQPDPCRAALHDIINARLHHRDHFADDADFAGWVVTRAMKALASRQEQPVPDGFVLVPKVSTSEMDLAGVAFAESYGLSVSRGFVEDMLVAILAAAPSPEGEDK